MSLCYLGPNYHKRSYADYPRFVWLWISNFVQSNWWKFKIYFFDLIDNSYLWLETLSGQLARQQMYCVATLETTTVSCFLLGLARELDPTQGLNRQANFPFSNLHQTSNYNYYFYFMLHQTEFAGQSALDVSNCTPYLVTKCIYDFLFSSSCKPSRGNS